MNGKLKPDVRYLCLHTLYNLPQAADVRAHLLNGIIAVLPSGDGVAASAATMLHHLKAFDDTQKQLALEFPNFAEGGRK